MRDDQTTVATLDDVTHRYGSTEALSHVTLALSVRAGDGAARSERRRQDDDRPPAHRAGPADASAPPRCSAATRRASARAAARRDAAGRARAGDADRPRAHRLVLLLLPRAAAARSVLEVAGLESIADRRYGQLSGGEKQRMLFALAICGNPALLFLDEPTVGMDVESRRRFWAGVRALAASGRSILLTTHYLEEADALASRIVVLNRGRVDRRRYARAASSGRPPAVRCVAGRAWRARLAPVAARRSAGGRRGRRVCCCSRATRTKRSARCSRRTSTACNLDVRSAGLEDAFLALTSADQEIASHAE